MDDKIKDVQELPEEAVKNVSGGLPSGKESQCLSCGNVMPGAKNKCSECGSTAIRYV